MTRNTLTKAKVVLVYQQKKSYTLTEKVSKKDRTNGIDYVIFLSDDWHCLANNSYGISFTFSNSCTHFQTFDDAKKFINEHRDEIKEASKRFTENGKGCKIKSLKIQGSYTMFYNKMNKEEAHSQKEAQAKWGKNLLFINYGDRCITRSCEPGERLPIFTVTKEEDALLFEFFQISKDADDNTQIIPSRDISSFRMYTNHTAYKVDYSNTKRKYIDNGQVFADSQLFKDMYGWGSERRGVNQSYDATQRVIEEGRCNCFTKETLQIIKDFGVPDFAILNGYSSGRVIQMDNISSMTQAYLNYLLPCSANETKICQEITEFLKNIPFDAEHNVVKYKNGYILRLGQVYQTYKCKVKRYCRDDYSIEYREKPYEGGENSELVFEQYSEWARLYINNSMSTRSLSVSYNGGKTWKHEGIHLIGELFRSNPETTNLDINVEECNRDALIKLYTVHPKLKYMKKYMEKHPDVLYESCVPFLRALFQYDMIIETLIALGKDDMFWTQVTEDSKHRYGHYYYRNRSAYKATKEVFDCDDFVETIGLKNIKQTGDFYQRLGLTKQQFKLLFEDTNETLKIFKTLKQCNLPLPDGSVCQLSHSWDAKGQRPKLRQVSFEDFKLVVDIIKKGLEDNDNYYRLSNDFNQLITYYGLVKRVHKALCQKTYDNSTLIDYLRMREQLIHDHFPDFKESIWDLFPDDQQDLQRYHDRILFMYNENNMVKDMTSGWGTGDTWIKNCMKINNSAELYLYLKERGIIASSLKRCADLVDQTIQFSDGFFSTADLPQKRFETTEDVEQMTNFLVERCTYFQNIYHMFWEENEYHSWHGDHRRRTQLQKWGVESYHKFVLRMVGQTLDVTKYDLYITLRQKFCLNDISFNVNEYPCILDNNEQLQLYYERLSAKEPELDALIAQRERERQEAIRKEHEAKTAQQQIKYIKRYEQLKKLNDKGDGERCIIVPKHLVSLIIEGQTLHHCVGSFVDSVSEGKNTIVFLRKVAEPDIPYVTISLLQNGEGWYIDQAHGDRNSNISVEDVAFLKTWAEKNNINVQSVKQNYGMHGHN